MADIQKVITDNNKSPLIQVITLVLLICSILSCTVRTVTKIFVIHKLRQDDILVVLATIFSVGQSAAVYYAGEIGLGRHANTLDAHGIMNIYKAQYAANSLFILVIVVCKISAQLTLGNMVQRNQEKWVLVCQAVTVCWAISSLFAIFFQCNLPRPWYYGDRAKCISLVGLWSYFSSVNIATDVVLIAIMAQNVARIQTSLSKQVLVICVFGSRVLVIPATAVQIYFSNKTFSRADDTFGWEATISMQVVQCLAIIVVCIPNLKPFLNSLESGQNRLDDQRRRGKTSGNGYPSNQPGYRKYKSPQNTQDVSANNSRARPFETELRTTDSELSYVHEMVDFSQHKPQTRGGGRGNGIAANEHGPSWDMASQTSQSSQSILIHQAWQDVGKPSQPRGAYYDGHAM